MKTFIYILNFLFLFLIITGCDEYLTTQPYGKTSILTVESQKAGIEGLLIAAYSNLDGYSIEYFPWDGASNWVFGSVAGGDAYKGSEITDQPDINYIETRIGLNANNNFLLMKWLTYYNGIARANDAIKAFRQAENMDYNHRLTRIAEARFLRGYYHFFLYKIFRNIPYIDDNVTDVRIGNTIDILPKIEEDFLFASRNLPKTQMDDRGRITKGAAQSFYGISKLWENPPKYDEAKIYFDSVIKSGIYHLNPTYHENFNAEYNNSPESILEVEQSVNDGANVDGWSTNGNIGDVLNFPYMGGLVGCCGFHQPSQDLVNAFKTDSFTGLPYLDDYNAWDVTSDQGLRSTDPFTPYPGTLDPRLDWTVGRRGIPYLDWGKHPGYDWIRDQKYGGPYSPKKNAFYQSQYGLYSDISSSSWTAGFNTNNLKLLRYADLLLFAAEAEEELGNLEKARDYVNQIRERAANPDGFVMNGDSIAANYKINTYSSFPDQEYARKAVRFERRLELGMEGHRFFDLVRWGVAYEVMNKYFEFESKNRDYFKEAKFKKGVNEIFPIPQGAIDNSMLNNQPTLKQNNGY